MVKAVSLLSPLNAKNLEFLESTELRGQSIIQLDLVSLEYKIKDVYNCHFEYKPIQDLYGHNAVSF
jgi:hypothetical protein